jgi:PAS domain S-box-containing protein
VTSCTPAAARLFGYTSEQATGSHIDDLVAVGDDRIRAEANEMSRRSTMREQSRLVTQRTRKDGTLVDVEVLSAPIVVSRKRVGTYALYHDISELQRA